MGSTSFKRWARKKLAHPRLKKGASVDEESTAAATPPHADCCSVPPTTRSSKATSSCESPARRKASAAATALFPPTSVSTPVKYPPVCVSTPGKISGSGGGGAGTADTNLMRQIDLIRSISAYLKDNEADDGDGDDAKPKAGRAAVKAKGSPASVATAATAERSHEVTLDQSNACLDEDSRDLSLNLAVNSILDTSQPEAAACREIKKAAPVAQQLDEEGEGEKVLKMKKKATPAACCDGNSEGKKGLEKMKRCESIDTLDAFFLKPEPDLGGGGSAAASAAYAVLPGILGPADGSAKVTFADKENDDPSSKIAKLQAAATSKLPKKRNKSCKTKFSKKEKREMMKRAEAAAEMARMIMGQVAADCSAYEETALEEEDEGEGAENKKNKANVLLSWECTSCKAPFQTRTDALVHEGACQATTTKTDNNARLTTTTDRQDASDDDEEEEESDEFASVNTASSYLNLEDSHDTCFRTAEDMCLKLDEVCSWFECLPAVLDDDGNRASPIRSVLKKMR